MSYYLDFTNQTKDDIEMHKKLGHKLVLKKLATRFNELIEHPYDGTGKSELLKYDLAGMWSRRINREHRLIYKVEDKKIVIVQ